MFGFKRKKSKKEKKNKKQNLNLENEELLEFENGQQDLNVENFNYDVQNENIDDSIENSENQNEQILIDQQELNNLKQTEFQMPINEPIYFSQEELVNRNLYSDTLYTSYDLEAFDLKEEDVVKFFKNGSVYYKLKDPLSAVNFRKIFKKDTRFSNDVSLKEMTESDLFFSDIKYFKDFDIESALAFDDGIKPELKLQIYELNEKLKSQLETIEEYKLNENELEKIAEAQKQILMNQKEIKEKIVNLKHDYANSNVFYRVSNIEFNTWNEDDIYFGYKLNDISFDIFSTDRIVIISDNSISNQLLIDVLRGDETKTSGYIYKNLVRAQKWIDIDDPEYDQYKIQSMDLNEEVYYGLTSPDYLSFGINKKDNVGITMSKIFKALQVQVNEQFKEKLLKLMKFESFLNVNVFELDDLNLEKFITICDILIGKKIILMKSICQGMTYNDKTELFKFLNKYFDAKKVTVLYAADDYLVANLLATKIMIIKEGNLIDVKRVDNLLAYFNSINDYILYTIKHGVPPRKPE